MRESFGFSPKNVNENTSHEKGGSLSIHEYNKQVPTIVAKEQKLGRGLGAYGRSVLAGFLAMTAVAIGEGTMREAHGQAGIKGGSAVEDVSDRYSREVGKVGQRYQQEGEQIEERAGKEVDTYKKQRKIIADHSSGTHVEIRQGYGGKKSQAQTPEQRHIGSEEQIDELAMQALRILYDIPNRDQAKHLIKDFAGQIHKDVGDAAEILSGNIERFINRLNNKPDGTFDSKAFDAFTRSIKNHPGIQEVLDSARFEIAPRPKGAPPR